MQVGERDEHLTLHGLLKMSFLRTDPLDDDDAPGDDSLPAGSSALTPSVSLDRDGTLHVRDLTIPPSDLWSREFADFYTRLAAISNAPAISLLPPARDASAAEWNRFDTLNEQRYVAAPLAMAKDRYPVETVETQLRGVHISTIFPRDGIPAENDGRVLINLRSGGFVSNRGVAQGQLESIPVAVIGRMKVITVDYRQAPFHEHPAASEDVETVYRGLLDQYAPGAIGIFGNSAGGVLAAQALALFQTKGLPRPAAVGIFSAALTPTWAHRQAREGDSRIWSGPVTPIPRSDLSPAAKSTWEPLRWYMEHADPDDPRAYPESSDAVLAGFPPTLFLNGNRDFTMSGAVVAHARLLRLNVDSSLYIVEGGTHCAYLEAVGTPEAHAAHAYVARWFDKHLAR